MISILVLSLLFLLLASATGFALISLTDSTTKLFGAQSDIDQINRWQSVITNSLRPYGESQKLVAPMGADSGLYHLTLPKVIDGSISLSTRNSYGKELIYCPLAEDLIAPAGTVTDNIPYQLDSTDTILTYEAETDTYENDIKYVLKIRDFDYLDSSLDGKTLAIIISPLTGEKISCKDTQIDANGMPVIYDSEGLPAGLVRLVSKDEKHSNSINKPIHVDSTDYNDSTQFNHLVGAYERVQPSRFILDLHDRGSDYLVTGDLTISSKFPGNKDQFVINGSGTGSVINALSPVTLQLENMSIKLNNVVIGNNVNLKIVNSLLEINDASVVINNLELDNSNFNNYVSVTINNKLTAENSEIKTSDVFTVNGGMDINSSFFNNNAEATISVGFNAENSNLRIDDTLNIDADDNIALNLDNSNIYLKSTLNLYKKPSFSQYALSLNGGSKFVSISGETNILNGENGNPPTNRSIYIDSTSILSLKNSSKLDSNIRHTEFMVNYGRIDVDGSNADISANTTYYVSLYGGSSLVINNSIFGSVNVTNTTINDKGANLVSGGGDPTSPFGSSNVSIYGNNCWNNSKPIFNSLFSNSSGYSRANSTANKVSNSSVWKCNF